MKIIKLCACSKSMNLAISSGNYDLVAAYNLVA